MTLELFLIACEMRVDGLTATAHRGMGKTAQCGMLTRGQWDGPEICNEVWRTVSAIHQYLVLFTIISQLFVLFPIISHVYYYLCYLLLFCLRK